MSQNRYYLVVQEWFDADNLEEAKEKFIERFSHLKYKDIDLWDEEKGFAEDEHN